MAKSNKKRKRFPVIAVLLIVVACGVFAYSAYRLVDYYREDKVAEQQAQELFELAVATVPPSGAQPASTEPETGQSTAAPSAAAATQAAHQTASAAEPHTDAAGETPAAGSAQPTQAAQSTSQAPQSTPEPTGEGGGEDPALPTAGPLIVDFDALHAVNPDICGWIYSPGTPINYPVVMSHDSSYYLTHLVDGTYSKAGSIFVDHRNSADFSDIHSIVYGHNMKSGTMFGSLKGYKNAAYYNAHPYMWLYTPDAVFRLDVAAGYVSPVGGAAYQFYYDVPSMRAYLASAVSKSAFTSAVDISSAERIVTLSTCTYEFNNARFVVVCCPVRVG